MYKILRNKSLKCVLPQIIACVVVLAVLLGICGSGLLRLVQGPKPMEPGVQTGQYVSFDASEVVVAFATLSSKSESDSKTIKTYYLLPDGAGSYLAVMDKKDRNSDVLDKAMEQSQEYYMGDLQTLTPLGPLQGTVKSIDDGMREFMVDCLEKYELPGYENGLESVSIFQVDLNSVGLLSETAAKVLGILAAVFFLLLAAQLIVVFAGIYQRRVRAVLGDSVSDEAFSQSAQIERIWVGEYIWYSKGPGSRALKTSDVIWGYAMPEPMVVSKYRWPVALYTAEQELVQINFMEQNSCERFLVNIAAQGHPFVKGYTSEYAELFQSDFDAFQSEAEQQAQARRTETSQQS